MPFEPVLFTLVILAGFYMAWNIGANDVANAMGTSVGSGALTLRQAVCVAAVLEFTGAFFFGSHVSETIQTGIVDTEIFAGSPETIVYGMLASLIASGVWLQTATYCGWPVSTTHTIVGAVVGFGVAIGGWDAIYWDHVSFIVTSWILSPFLGGILSYTIFNIMRKHIFYSRCPVEATKRLAPAMLFTIVAILTFILISSGLKNLELPLTNLQKGGYSVLAGLVSAAACFLFVRSKDWGSSHLGKESAKLSNAQFAIVEQIFGYLQIVSACLMAFAHGANDVANAIGPLSAAITVMTTGVLSEQASVSTWALALGGVGIVIGLATWGWRVIETIGKKITELTPSRGFAAEFGAAVTIVLASGLGLPISATHTLVGSVLGVGLARGIEALNLGIMRDIVISWIITIPAGAILCVAFFELIKAVF